MVSEYNEITGDLRNKLDKVYSLHGELDERNQELEIKTKELEKKLKEKEQEIEFVTNKYNKLKLAKGILATAGDKHDAKIKINRIVREIDKCIALLNR